MASLLLVVSLLAAAFLQEVAAVAKKSALLQQTKAISVLSSGAHMLGKRKSSWAGAHHSASQHMAHTVAAQEQKSTCAPLTNHGSHFTIDLQVGTPQAGTASQSFSVVADTGSNSLIVLSCLCEENGSCNHAAGRCFRGNNRSSTFMLYKSQSTQQPVAKILSFGSGQIEGVLAMDWVTISTVSAYAHDGFLLMVDQALDVPGPFEGILGLGVPQRQMAAPSQDQAASTGAQNAMDGEAGESDGIPNRFLSPPGGAAGRRGGADPRRVLERVVQEILGDAGGAGSGALPFTGTMGGDLVPEREEVVVGLQSLKRGSRSLTLPNAMSHRPEAQGFLEQANVSSFSLCLDDNQGALRLDPQDMPMRLSSVGQVHWGLGLQGISVGSANISARLNLCSAEAMQEGQETPCGFIPDSGTTLLMGPAKQVTSVLEGICDGWPRCVANHSALRAAAEAAEKAATETYGFSPWELEAGSKEEVLKILLADCGSWIKNSTTGLGELPAVHFHVSGKDPGNGQQQVLEVGPEHYVMETVDESNQSRCMAGFSAMEYPTAINGEVWIAGMPTFFAHTVFFDTSTSPPSMAFKSTKESACGSCEESGTALLAGQRQRRHPRRVAGPPRLPSFDVSQSM